MNSDPRILVACMYFSLCFLVPMWARSWGRSAVVYFFGSLFCSPFLAAIALLIDGRNPKKKIEGGADSQECPCCEKLNRREATTCKYCGSDL